jgi:hypothetical protein
MVIRDPPNMTRRGRVNKFNILKQSKDYDEQGDYVRLWCPELSNVPAPKVHTPWQLSQQERSEFKLDVLPYPQVRGSSPGAGNVYPSPIKENSPGPTGGGYGGDKEGQWKGGNAKKRWDNIGDRWTGEKSRGGARGGGGGGSRGKGRATANAKRQDFMNAHMGVDHN